MFRRFMVSLLLVFLLVGAFAGSAFGSVVLFAGYGSDVSNLPQTLDMEYNPGPSYVGTTIAMVFNSSFSGYVYSAMVYFVASGMPVGYIGCGILELNSSGLPTENFLGYSTNLVKMSWVSNVTKSEFWFYFGSGINLVQYTKYALAVYVSSYTLCDGTDNVRVCGDASDGYAEGECYSYHGNDPVNHWIKPSGLGTDWTFAVYGVQSGGSGGGAWGGGGTGDSGDGGGEGTGIGDGNTWGSSTTSSFYDVLVIVAFLFAPALVLILMGAGKWGFIGGFTVGALALCTCVNVVMGRELFPMWGLYGVIVVDVVSVWGSVKGVF